MNADEIRKLAGHIEQRSAFAKSDDVNWLAEIAAQLAELNETLRDRAVSVQIEQHGNQHGTFPFVVQVQS